jgi:hypothetical protein
MQSLLGTSRLQVDSWFHFLFNSRLLYGQIAQLVEQRIENPRVGGSIPSLATTQIRILHITH